MTEDASLRGQNMTLNSRGQNFAYYSVDAYSDSADTLRCQYRVPAGVKNRKLKALLYVNSSADEINLKRLDGFGPAGVTAVLNLNLYKFFERDSKGKIKSAKKSAFAGVLKTRRSVDVLAQLLRKHQAINSEQIFVAGDSEAAVLLLPALGGFSTAFAGLALTNFDTGLTATEKIQEYEFAGVKVWSALISGNITVFPAIPNGILFARTPQMLDGSSLEDVLRWVAGGDTTALPDQSDTTFTRVMKVES